MAKNLMSKKDLRKVRKLISSPLVRYLGAGVLGVIAYRGMRAIEERYPELHDLTEDGLRLIEDKLSELRDLALKEAKNQVA